VGKSPLCPLCRVVSQIPLQRLVASLLRTCWRANKSATSWQLPRLRESYGETCVMDIGHCRELKIHTGYNNVSLALSSTITTAVFRHCRPQYDSTSFRDVIFATSRQSHTRHPPDSPEVLDHTRCKHSCRGLHQLC